MPTTLECLQYGFDRDSRRSRRRRALATGEEKGKREKRKAFSIIGTAPAPMIPCPHAPNPAPPLPQGPGPCYDGLYQVTQRQRGFLNTGATAIGGVPAQQGGFGYDETGNWVSYRQTNSGELDIDRSRGNNLTPR